MTPDVSVIIATYNYGRYLAGALDSVLGQTFRNLEVIVVDDGSTDDTAAVMAPYLDEPRVRYLRTDHLGQPGAKNTGIRQALAPLIAFLDADDLWLPMKLERQVELFQADPELGVVYCRRRWIDEEGRELDRTERPLHRGEVLPQVFRESFICFSSTVIRRAVLDNVGLFDEEIPMSIDYELWLRIAMRYRFDYVDEPLVLYRTGHANLSSRLDKRVGCVWRIVDRFLDERGGRRMLSPALIRRTLAELCCDTARIVGTSSWTAALPWYMKSLRYRPHHYNTWKGLLTGWWPEWLVSSARRALKGPGWRTRRLNLVA